MVRVELRHGTTSSWYKMSDVECRIALSRTILKRALLALRGSHPSARWLNQQRRHR